MPQAATAKKPLNPKLDATALLEWYDRHARKLPWRVSPKDRAQGEMPDPYRVWLSEIMLQQTTVAAVGDYFYRFTTLWPTVTDLAAAPLEDVLTQWAGLGYYARARNLHAAAKMVADELGGRFPKDYDGLLTLPGVGPYTAAAIAAICYDERVPVVDGNVERVMARLTCLSVPVREAKPEIKSALETIVPERAGDFAQAMMDLGATICAPRAAACLLCPLESGCAGSASGHPTDYPVKPVKAERPTRFGHAFVIMDKNKRVLLRQRPEKGLLAQMTEVPTSDWGNKREKVEFPFSGDWRRAGDVVHVFTHFRLELDVWLIKLDEEVTPLEGWWSANPAGEALPSLFKKVLATIDPKGR